jgi:hypothetical protein
MPNNCCLFVAKPMEVKTIKLTTCKLPSYDTTSATNVVLSRKKFTKIVGGRDGALDLALSLEKLTTLP